MRMEKETGVFIRGQRADGSWGSFDLGDPELQDLSVSLWLRENGVNGFGVRLIGLLLGRGALLTEANP